MLRITPAYFWAMLVAVSGIEAYAQQAQESAVQAAEAPAIGDLIDQLGSDDYFTRNAAERRLIQIGPEAFDALKRAERSTDLEVAARARYIVEQVRVQWRRPNDPIEVRQALARYEDASDDRREQVAPSLARLPDGAGAAALARIARFDGSALVARLAALELLEMDAEVVQNNVDSIIRELGSSERTPVEWVRKSISRSRDPEQVAAAWRAAVIAEHALFAKDSKSTDGRITWRLWRHELDFCQQAGLPEATAAALTHFVETSRQGKGRLEEKAALLYVLRWCLDHEAWQPLAILEDEFRKEFTQDRAPLYCAATAYGLQGSDELAKKTADKAYHLVADDDDERLRTGRLLTAYGRFEWAQREWNYVIDNFPETDVNSVIARYELSNTFFDHLKFQEAAALLEPTCDAIEENRAELRRLTEELENASRDWSRGAPELDDVRGRRHYYLACHYEAIGDYQREARHLQQAAELYEANIDVLIAMHHCQAADDKYRAQTQMRIKKARQRQMSMIQQYDAAPADEADPRPYNEWAWITANIGGSEEEIARAIRYSHRSLKISPEQPAYLDTLGRCYYAAGDYANAVKYQRMAIEGQPYLQVMRRQLALFEQALAREQSKRDQTEQK